MKYEKLFVFLCFGFALGGILLTEPYLMIASCFGFMLLTALSFSKSEK